jgi:hypothetical protein
MDGTMRMTRSGARARVSSFVIDLFGLKADGKQGALFGRERTCRFVFRLWQWFFRCFLLSTSIIKVTSSLLAWHRSTMPCLSSLACLVHSSSRVFRLREKLSRQYSTITPPAIRSIRSHTLSPAFRSPLPTHGPWGLPVRERVPPGVTHPSRTASTPSRRRTRTTMVSEHSGRIPSRILPFAPNDTEFLQESF